jgi:hypothetical protein
MAPRPAPATALAALSDGLLRSVEGSVVDTGPVRRESEQSLNENDPNAGVSMEAILCSWRKALLVIALVIRGRSNENATQAHFSLRSTGRFGIRRHCPKLNLHTVTSPIR